MNLTFAFSRKRDCKSPELPNILKGVSRKKRFKKRFKGLFIVESALSLSS